MASRKNRPTHKRQFSPLNPADPRWDWCFGLPLQDKLTLLITGDRNSVPHAFKTLGGE